MLLPCAIRNQKSQSGRSRKSTLMSFLCMGTIYGSAIAPAYASPSQPVHTTSSHVNISITSHDHPILRALSHLLGFKSQLTPSAPLKTTHDTLSSSALSKQSSANAVISSVHTDTDPHYHRFLNLFYHLVHQFIGPYSFSPSAKTLAHAAGKTPVILVHGTWWDADSLSEVYHSLDNAGIPAYAITMGTGGLSLAGLIPHLGGVNTIENSEKQLVDFINKVQAETGAKKIDLIGHSQGGLLIKDYIAHDTKDNIQAVVDLGATNRGSTLDGGSYLLNLFPQPIKNILIKTVASIVGPGGTDQLPYSKFVSALDKTPDTKAGIHYLVLGTRDDLISTPYWATFLKAVPGADVINKEVHTIPGVTGFVGHNMLPLNPVIVNYFTKYIEENGQPAGQDTYASSAVSSPATKVVTTPQPDVSILH